MSGKNHAKIGFYKKVGSIGHEVYKHSHICNPNKWGPIRPNNPSKGLWQGDPLLPYLFPICAEGLSTMLHQVVQDKRLKDISVYRRGPKISHLFFANNSLIFGRATMAKCLEIQRILNVYEASSGQQLNK